MDTAIPIRAFTGFRREDGCDVRILYADGSSAQLEHRVRHSPTGFEWGYGGSGPTDLALSIGWLLLGGDPGPEVTRAIVVELIAPLEDDGWSFPASRVMDVIARVRERRAARESA